MAAKKKGEAKETVNGPHTRKFMIKLPSKERETKAKRLAAAEIELQAKIGEKKTADSAYSTEIKTLRDEIRVLSIAVHEGKEERDIECFERRDDRRGHMEMVRRDTGEVVDERPLTAEERQLNLPSTEAKPKRSRKPANAEA